MEVLNSYVNGKNPVIWGEILGPTLDKAGSWVNINCFQAQCFAFWFITEKTEKRVMSIHGLVRWLRPLFLVLDSGHIDTWQPGWSVTGVPSEILGEALSLHQLWKLHVPESLCLGIFQWGTHVHLELGFLSCSPRPMCPTYHLIPLRHLNHAESHVKFQLWFLQGQTFQLWHFNLPEAMKSVQIFSCLPGRADLSFGWSVQLWSYCSFAIGTGTVFWITSVPSQNFVF